MITARDLQKKLTELLPEAQIMDVTQEVPFRVRLGEETVEFTIPLEELMDLELDLIADMYLGDVVNHFRA